MRDKVEEIIITALEEMNEDREDKFTIDESLTFFGRSGVLDSMDLVSLTVDIEEKLSDELDLEVTIASDKAFSRSKSPFYNVESLTSFIIELSKDNQ